MSDEDQVEGQEAMPGMEPEEPAGDPVPDPVPERRKRGRPRKSGAAPGGSAPAPPADRAPSVRASKAAVSGARAVYGGVGMAATFGGQALLNSPGIMAAGFVMQAQADDAGKVIARKAVGTRWYPYLERMGTGGELAPFILAPLIAAAYVGVPQARGIIGPLAMQILDGITTEVPDAEAEGGKRVVNVFAEIQDLVVELDRHAPPVDVPDYPPGAAEAPEEAPANGEVPPDILRAMQEAEEMAERAHPVEETPAEHEASKFRAFAEEMSRRQAAEAVEYTEGEGGDAQGFPIGE